MKSCHEFENQICTRNRSMNLDFLKETGFPVVLTYKHCRSDSVSNQSNQNNKSMSLFSACEWLPNYVISHNDLQHFMFLTLHIHAYSCRILLMLGLCNENWTSSRMNWFRNCIAFWDCYCSWLSSLVKIYFKELAVMAQRCSLG